MTHCVWLAVRNATVCCYFHPIAFRGHGRSPPLGNFWLFWYVISLNGQLVTPLSVPWRWGEGVARICLWLYRYLRRIVCRISSDALQSYLSPNRPSALGFQWRQQIVCDCDDTRWHPYKRCHMCAFLHPTNGFLSAIIRAMNVFPTSYSSGRTRRMYI